MIETTEIGQRIAALEKAREFVTPIVEDFKPEAYESITMPSAVFTIAPRTTTTPAEQVARLYMDIAEWILKEHRD